VGAVAPGPPRAGRDRLAGPAAGLAGDAPGRELAGASNGLNILYVSCGGFALLLTPTGRLPSRRWRWWAWAAAVFVAASALDPVPLYPDHPEIGSPLGVQAMAEPPLDLVIPAAGVVVLVALVVAAGSLVGLFRASVVSAWPCRRWPPGRPSCATGGGRRRPAGRDLRRHHQDPPLQGRRADDITGRCGGGNLGVSATLVGLAAGTLAALGVWGCCTGAAIGRPGPVGTLRAGSGNPGPAMT
jgi:hypothetical protein